MTISDQTAFERYTANGASASFEFPHPMQSSAELRVTKKPISTGVEATLVLGTDYTITGTPDANGNYTSGCTVVVTVMPTNGDVFTLERSTFQTQTAAYSTADKFPSQTHEKALDKMTLLLQEFYRTVSRAVVTGRTSAYTGLVFPDPADGKLIKWSGSTITNSTVNDTDLITASTNAAASATAAANSASAASTSATNAAASASAASTSATNASNSATSAAGSASAANTSATNAATSETNAATSATNAANSAAAAAASAASMVPATVADTLAGTDNSKYITAADLASTWAQGTDIASAATLPIPSTGGGYFNVTGTTTITNLSQANLKTGRKVQLVFAGALTLSNSANMILPSSLDILTTAGDIAEFTCEDAVTPKWRCTDYHRASTGAGILSPGSVTDILAGTITTSRYLAPQSASYLWRKGTDIASAAALSIPTTGGGYFHVTGTTAITSISHPTSQLVTGREITLAFDGILTLTHNATSLILPGAANITTAAGDVASFRCEDATNNYWRCTKYTKADGTAPVSSSSGGYVLLGTGTASNTASLNFDGLFSSSYDTYEFEMIDLIPQTGTTNQLQIRVNQSGTTQTGSSYTMEGVYTNSAASNGAIGGTALSSINPTNAVNMDTTMSLSGWFKLHNPLGTVKTHRMMGQVNYNSTAPNSINVSFGGGYTGNTLALSGINISFSGGNIASGTVRLYGRKNS
ncbi:MAG TPA: hypothetical protein VN081_03890 [Dongiaceae bacterium]|nr:hypothetical protein [Dongiaceae bacterium]